MKQKINGLDVDAERRRLQLMLQEPSDSLEKHFRVHFLANRSEPKEWDDETVTSCYYCWRVYTMGWNDANVRREPTIVELSDAINLFENAGPRPELGMNRAFKFLLEKVSP